MQRYVINQQEQKVCKKFLAEFFDFLKYKVENDLLTVEEAEALTKILRDNVPLSGTSEDFARFFGQSPVNVRSVISRKLLAKPKRKVLYPFSDFLEVIPNKWSNKNCCK